MAWEPEIILSAFDILSLFMLQSGAKWRKAIQLVCQQLDSRQLAHPALVALRFILILPDPQKEFTAGKHERRWKILPERGVLFWLYDYPLLARSANGFGNYADIAVE